MRQGNTYSLAIELQDDAGSVIDIDLVTELNLFLGRSEKRILKTLNLIAILGSLSLA